MSCLLSSVVDRVSREDGIAQLGLKMAEEGAALGQALAAVSGATVVKGSGSNEEDNGDACIAVPVSVALEFTDRRLSCRRSISAGVDPLLALPSVGGLIETRSARIRRSGIEIGKGESIDDETYDIGVKPLTPGAPGVRYSKKL